MKLMKLSIMGAMCAFMFTACQKEEGLQSQTNPVYEDNERKPTFEYTAQLSAMNSSGVSGTATLTIDGDELTVHIMASGLEPNQLHPQHIHGSDTSKTNAICPPMSADTNNDGLVDLVEGLPFYGPVLLSLTPTPTADANGEIHYTQTFMLGSNGNISASDLMPLQNRAIVLHGMTVNGMYMATLPVACGTLMKTGVSPNPGPPHNN